MLARCMSFPPTSQIHSLSPHPATTPGPVRELQASVRREGDTLLLQYRLEGDLDSILLPQQTMPRRADNLWKHSCFEAFLGGPGLSPYREYNFSPSGGWAIYDFDGYRSGMRTDPWVAIPAGRDDKTGAATAGQVEQAGTSVRPSTRERLASFP